MSWSRDGEYVLMDRKGEDGYYDIYRFVQTAATRPASHATFRRCWARHIGQPEWHPSGKIHGLSGTEDFQARAVGAGPGRHARLRATFRSVVDGTGDTTLLFALTDTPQDDTSGVLHPLFSRDGSKLTWGDVRGAEVPRRFRRVEDPGRGFLPSTKGSPVLSNLQSYVPASRGGTRTMVFRWISAP